MFLILVTLCCLLQSRQSKHYNWLAWDEKLNIVYEEVLQKIVIRSKFMIFIPDWVTFSYINGNRHIHKIIITFK